MNKNLKLICKCNYCYTTSQFKLTELLDNDFELNEMDLMCPECDVVLNIIKI